MNEPLNYLSGFGNQFASEAVPGALPQGRNSPQKVAHGLYAERLSGSAFTTPRADNHRSWMYRTRPSVMVGAFEPLAHASLKTGAKDGIVAPPDPMRWTPVAIPDAPADFIEGLRTFVVNGDADAQVGMAAHLYLANRSPFNVVAWHGTLVPCKYDTRHFMTIGSISFDHPDPSIFTVLTSPSDTPGWASCDFVIFSSRWLVAEDTFRPPWYHRNVMSEFMGLVHGQYDAKPEGFKPGGMSLHDSMVPHGPDAEAFTKASNADLAPHKLDNTLAFMFESRWRFHLTEFALHGGALDRSYADCWLGLADNFKARS